MADTPTLQFFRPSEFACRCRCGAGIERMDHKFVEKLEAARRFAGVPFRLTSAYRCPAHNAQESKVEMSAHTRGHAVDILVSGSRMRFTVVDALRAQGFTRFGVGEHFVHVDDDPDKPEEVMWLYA